MSVAGPSGEAVADAGVSDAGEASAAKACSNVGLASGVLPPEVAGAESATAVVPSMSSFAADTALPPAKTRAQNENAPTRSPLRLESTRSVVGALVPYPGELPVVSAAATPRSR